MKWLKNSIEGIIVAGGYGEGNNLTQLSYSRGMIVDDLDNIYIVDSFNDRIMCWSKGSKEGRIIIFGENANEHQINQINRFEGIAMDREGHLYISDKINHRISVNTYTLLLTLFEKFQSLSYFYVYID